MVFVVCFILFYFTVSTPACNGSISNECSELKIQSLR